MSYSATINSTGITYANSGLTFLTKISSDVSSNYDLSANNQMDYGAILIDTDISFNNNNIIIGGGGSSSYSRDSGKSGNHGIYINQGKTVTKLVNKKVLSGGGGGGGSAGLSGKGGDGYSGGGGGGGNYANGGDGGKYDASGNPGIGTNGGGGGGVSNAGNRGGSGGSNTHPAKLGGIGNKTGGGGGGGGDDDNGSSGRPGGGGTEGNDANSYGGGNGGYGYYCGGGGGARGGNGGPGNYCGGGGGNGGGYGGYGSVYGGNGGYGIFNNGTIRTLENDQGINSGFGGLFYTGTLPDTYNIIIRDASQNHGELFYTGWNNPTKGTLNNFGLSSDSDLSRNAVTYDAVLVNVNSLDISGSSLHTNISTNGLVKENTIFHWTLINVPAGEHNCKGKIVSIGNRYYDSYDLFIDSSNQILSINGPSIINVNSKQDYTVNYLVSGYIPEPNDDEDTLNFTEDLLALPAGISFPLSGTSTSVRELFKGFTRPGYNGKTISLQLRSNVTSTISSTIEYISTVEVTSYLNPGTTTTISIPTKFSVSPELIISGLTDTYFYTNTPINILYSTTGGRGDKIYSINGHRGSYLVEDLYLLHINDGLLNGTIQKTGTYNLEINVTDENHDNKTISLKLVIEDPPQFQYSKSYPPEIINVLPLKKSAKIIFNTPQYTGSLEILFFTIYCSDGQRIHFKPEYNNWNNYIETFEKIFPNLQEGQLYTFQMTATNIAGESDRSPLSKPYLINHLPGAGAVPIIKK